MQGGVAQGAGQVFTELAVYDAVRPAPHRQLHGLRHAARRAMVGGLKLLEHPVPTKLNPLGAKGVGEAGVTGSMPALMNAVVDALRSRGVRALRDAGHAAAPMGGAPGGASPARRRTPAASARYGPAPRRGGFALRAGERCMERRLRAEHGRGALYYALFSIAPLLLIVIGVAGLLLRRAGGARRALRPDRRADRAPTARSAVEGLVANARQAGERRARHGRRHRALLVIGASTVFGELQNALDRIWRAPARENARAGGSSYVRGFLLRHDPRHRVPADGVARAERAGLRARRVVGRGDAPSCSTSRSASRSSRCSSR